MQKSKGKATTFFLPKASMKNKVAVNMIAAPDTTLM